MRRILLSALLLSTAVPAAFAQPRPPRAPHEPFSRMVMGDPDRAVLGVGTSSEGKRDTLGVLVTSVTEGSPAEKAGIEEGTRIGSINGVSLKLSRDDAGDEEMMMGGMMSRRLEREMRKLKAGDEATLELWAGGRWKTVKVKSVAAGELSPMRHSRASEEERAALGISISSTGRKRDTVGVFVSDVSENGPAEKAGIVEGDRIASINGVDVRTPREDAGDRWASSSRERRLQRMIRKLKAGQAAELVVVTGGRSRTVKVTAVRARDLMHHDGTEFFRFGDGMEGMNWDGLNETLRRVVPEVQRQIDRELPRAIDEVRRSMDRLPMELRLQRARVGSRVMI